MTRLDLVTAPAVRGAGGAVCLLPGPLNALSRPGLLQLHDCGWIGTGSVNSI
jgi:hypothetical protein